MFENPRRGRQARNFTTNVLKILDLKSSSEQIFSENWRWVPLTFCFCLFFQLSSPFFFPSRHFITHSSSVYFTLNVFIWPAFCRQFLFHSLWSLVRLIAWLTLFLTAAFKTLAVNLPLGGRPQSWPSVARRTLADFFRSDHFEFWNADPSLPAVFITDTADFRGFMKQCYHQSCDDISQVTPDMIAFLARTTESILNVASNLTSQKCEIKQAGMASSQQFTSYRVILLDPWNRY